MSNRFIGSIKKGVSGVRAAYAEEKRKSAVAAKTKMRRAKTQYARDRVKAEEKTKLLVLQREMYEARSAATREKEAVTRARHDAGAYTFGERLSSAGRIVGRQALATYRDLAKPSPKRIIRRGSR